MTLPRTSIQPRELAIVVNDQDPQSLAVAKYYQAKRGIPDKNVVKLSFPTTAAELSPAQFAPLKSKLDAALDNKIQALALTWLKPYRVSCMGITSAFALGWDQKYCTKAAKPFKCRVTATVPYYKHSTTRPYTDLGIRPAMMLAGVSEAEVKQVIDRGLAADSTFPGGTGYMIRTTDSARSNARYQAFQTTVKQLSHAGGLKLHYIDNAKGPKADNVIEGKKGVLFYFTGLTTVPKIATNTYLPGAVADHLTSFGGRLTAKGAPGQMSVLRWLEAGATASYGTAHEPCSFATKFPDTRLLLPYYFMGNTVVEAYWKSVQMPGEGVFVGDPLARPWGSSVNFAAGKLSIRTTSLLPGKRYTLYGKQGQTGKLVAVLSGISVTRYQLKEIVVSPAKHTAYELKLESDL